MEMAEREKRQVFKPSAGLPEAQKPQPMGRLINWALFDLLAKYPHALVFGRHNRCSLAIPHDTRVSLRHILLTAWPGQGALRLRGSTVPRSRISSRPQVRK